MTIPAASWPLWSKQQQDTVTESEKVYICSRLSGSDDLTSTSKCLLNETTVDDTHRCWRPTKPRQTMFATPKLVGQSPLAMHPNTPHFSRKRSPRKSSLVSIEQVTESDLHERTKNRKRNERGRESERRRRNKEREREKERVNNCD